MEIISPRRLLGFSQKIGAEPFISRLIRSTQRNASSLLLKGLKLVPSRAVAQHVLLTTFSRSTGFRAKTLSEAYAVHKGGQRDI